MHQDEWKQIYETYYQTLYLYALSLTGRYQDAEDLLQETFVKAFLSYENKGSLKCWLITVLRNEYYNLIRKRRKEVLDGGDLILEKSVLDDGMLEKLISEENRRLLFREINHLPEQMREVLMESTYFHISDEEIAKLHGISEVNVRKIRSRGKQKLIERMKEDR